MEHSPPLLEGGGGGRGGGVWRGGTPPPSGRTTIALGLLGRPQLRMAPQGPSEIAKTLGVIGKTHMEKINAQNLIKPIENEDFWAPFSKNDPK